MSKNRWVNTRFWGDNYIIDLDPSEKLLFLYCLTNDHTSLCGAYEINLRTIALETGFDKEMILKIFNRFEKDGKIAYCDGYVIVRNFRKHQADNPKIRAGIEREEKDLPEHIKDSLCIGYQSLSKPINTLPIPKLIPKPNGKAEVSEKPSAGGVTREVILEHMNPDTYTAWMFFESTCTQITTNLEENRAAINRFLKRDGLEGFQKLCKLAARAWSEKYTPKEVKASTPVSLEQKRGALLMWAKGKFTQHSESTYTFN